MEAPSRIVRRNLREPFKIHRSLWIAGAISQQNEHLLRSTNTFRRLMHHEDRSKLLVLHAASVMLFQPFGQRIVSYFVSTIVTETNLFSDLST